MHLDRDGIEMQSGLNPRFRVDLACELFTRDAKKETEVKDLERQVRCYADAVEETVGSKRHQHKASNRASKNASYISFAYNHPPHS